MGTELVEKYSNLVWKYVRSFARKFDGFKNFPVIDVDDLYQECMEDLFNDYLQSGKTEEQFECNHMRLYNTMHMYVKKCLPVRTAYRTAQYTEDMRKYANTVNVDDVRDLVYKTDSETDRDFEIDCDIIQQKLPHPQRMIFHSFRMGSTDTKIMRDLNITIGKLRNSRIKIARVYNRTTGQHHQCKWREH